MSRLEPCAPGRLGAHVVGDGVDFTIRSRDAQRIEVCVFDATGTHERGRLELPARTGDVFHGRLPGAGAGLVYGLRAHGRWAPREHRRFNPDKLLVDPWARELVGAFRWDDAVLGHVAGHSDGFDARDARDSAPFVPKARVAAPPAALRDRPPRPRRPWDETVVYEAHVRGFSMTNPAVPPALRGTFAGLAHPASIAHLRALGVTAVELLPVAAWLDELHLVRRGLVNYWGYNPIAFFAPQPALAGAGGLATVIAAVDALHEAGIEVILDVVFNHTAEGDERGPTLSMRGLDDAVWYEADAARPGGYLNRSGCGNTLAAWRPEVGETIVDALRHWAGVVGVDGFRFDLASAIARDADGRFEPDLPWIRALRDDPVLSGCKLVAEGWDCEGHFVGGFPPGWAEWNDRFRDDTRRVWLRRAHGVAALATRLAGSSDLFGRAGRGPVASVNFVAAHDGFTLADVVSHSRKRNHANGEDDRDGNAHEVADGGGAEGPTDAPAILRARARRLRALLATLMLSRGVPMLRAGDEFAATQGGNNNAYCQDGPTTWLRWPDGAPADGAAASPVGDLDLRGLVATLARIRAALPCLRGDAFLTGRASPDAEALPDVAWLREDGAAMTEADWHDGARSALALQLDAGVPRPGAPHDRVWIGLHAGDGPLRFVLPAVPQPDGWVRLLDTAAEAPPLEVDADGGLVVDGPGVVVCAAGTAARAERARWRPGLPAVAFVAGNDPAPGVEIVVAAGTVGAAASPGVAVVADSETGRVPEPPRDPAPDGRHEGRPEAAGAAPADPAIDLRRVDGVTLERRRVRLPSGLAPGAHRLRANTAPGAASAGRLFVHPTHCFVPDVLSAAPGAWALSVQLYGLRSATNWGIGDLDDLAGLARRAGAQGASALLVSPLHAPSFGWSDRGSPYSPSSRLAINPLYVSLARAAEGFASPGFDAWSASGDVRAAIEAARRSPQVDLGAVLALKRDGLERLWRDLQAGRSTAGGRDALRAYEAWRAGHGARLRAHALFETIAERLGSADRRAWPPAFAAPEAPGARALEREQAERFGFHLFVQWLAAAQWRAVGEAAAGAGMPIGPIADLAVGADAAGADAWAWPAVVADDHEAGAPPDAFAAEGQAWGLPPWRPEALAAAGHAPLAALLEASMDGAGGLRIDHVMALERLYWVPRGRPPAEGAYVSYPLEDLLRIVAAQSARARCLVVGEDLGTVRPGLRERLAVAGVLSYKVAWFERAANGTLADPGSLPALAAVCASTHDLPTIDGWAAALDIDERERLGLLDTHAAGRAREDRHADLARIDAGLDRAGIAGQDRVERLHRWLAASGARLAIVQLEDVAGLARQPNLPGTPDVAPNWRQKLPVALEALDAQPRWRALASIFAARRARIAR